MQARICKIQDPMPGGEYDPICCKLSYVRYRTELTHFLSVKFEVDETK